jgi:precorrin-2 dehydrogenase/sirohydrochlorin ferrochelatase
MKIYPVGLHVEGRHCVVIGGGEVAARKVESLLEAGALVTVISPKLGDELAERAARGEVTHLPRAYGRGDLAAAFLAFAATDDEETHAEIAREAEEEGVLLNVVDRLRWCTFIVPSIARRGDLTVAVSTGGSSPALARRVREEIEGFVGPQYERAALLLGRVRRHLQEREPRGEERQRILNGLVRSELIDLLRRPDTDAVDRLLSRDVGEGVSLSSLGLAFPAAAERVADVSTPEHAPARWRD